jgi:hypothetical protein
LTCFILRASLIEISQLLKRAFIEGLFGLTVRKQAESSLLRKELREKEVLLDTYRTRKSSKRVTLKDQIIISWESIQRVVEKMDNQTSTKKKKKGKQGSSCKFRR